LAENVPIFTSENSSSRISIACPSTFSINRYC
jgi:hypothetical protein